MHFARKGHEHLVAAKRIVMTIDVIDPFATRQVTNLHRPQMRMRMQARARARFVVNPKQGYFGQTELRQVVMHAVLARRQLMWTSMFNFDLQYWRGCNLKRNMSCL